MKLTSAHAMGLVTALVLVAEPHLARPATPGGSFQMERITNQGPLRVRVHGQLSDPDYPNPIWMVVRISEDASNWYLYDAQFYTAADHQFEIADMVLGPGTHYIWITAPDFDSNGNPNGAIWTNLTPAPASVEGNPDEYALISWNPNPGQEDLDNVRVIVNRTFGGAITKMHYVRLGGTASNLIDGEQCGAMFQPAFWLLPWHEAQPGCDPARSDMHFDNPTQAGFAGNGWAGNPIGFMGTSSIVDPKEFLNYENPSTKDKIHLKSKFIRYDYCQSSAPMDRQAEWDTNFYIEQWIYFHASFPHILVIENKISNEGSETEIVSTRQWPVIFAFHLPRIGFWQSGQKTILQNQGEMGVNPDRNWAALLAADQERGIGMVYAPCSGGLQGRKKFGYGVLGETGRLGEILSVLYPSENGIPDLRTFGTLDGAVPNSDGVSFDFPPGSSFTWTLYYPLGEINWIKEKAESLHSSYGSIPCDDGNACSFNDLCAGTGVCEGTAYACNDNNVCTNDACQGDGSCGYVNNAASCDDNNLCTEGDVCSGGLCAGKIRNCDDENLCTDDSCNSADGTCVNQPNDAVCDDHNPCTKDDRCNALGVCLGIPDPLCAEQANVEDGGIPEVESPESISENGALDAMFVEDSRDMVGEPVIVDETAGNELMTENDELSNDEEQIVGGCGCQTQGPAPFWLLFLVVILGRTVLTKAIRPRPNTRFVP